MQTFVIQSQKGGSGKTMLAAHLAVEAERCGHPTWLIDTDPQGTLGHWHERRVAERPPRLDVSGPWLTKSTVERVALGLDRVSREGAALCIIDCPGAISEQNTALLSLADLVLVPVRPSPSDLWAVAETVALIKAADKPFLFVLAQAKAQATITAQAVAALSEHGRVAQAFVTDRVAYAAAMTGGLTAPELRPKGAEAAEVTALWREIISANPQNANAAKAKVAV
jgi:chromosome partitioning protein